MNVSHLRQKIAYEERKRKALRRRAMMETSCKQWFKQHYGKAVNQATWRRAWDNWTLQGYKVSRLHDKLDIALDAVPYYELWPVPTFWRGV